MSKANEIIEELNALEESDSPNFKSLNAMINKIAMANDTKRGGKGSDPKMEKEAAALLKKMTDSEELSPNDMKKLASRLTSAMGESIDEGDPRIKKFQDAVDKASNGAAKPTISVFLANAKGLFTDLPKKFTDVKSAMAYIKGVDGSDGIEVRADGTKVKDWV